jgi:hypothetical protein
VEYGSVHTVTIFEEDGELNWEVEHTPNCETHKYDDPLFGSGEFHICGVQHELDAIGIDALVDGDGQALSPGTYQFRSWWHYDSWNREYDGGLELVINGS